MKIIAIEKRGHPHDDVLVTLTEGNTSCFCLQFINKELKEKGVSAHNSVTFYIAGYMAVSSSELETILAWESAPGNTLKDYFLNREIIKRAIDSDRRQSYLVSKNAEPGAKAGFQWDDTIGWIPLEVAILP